MKNKHGVEASKISDTHGPRHTMTPWNNNGTAIWQYDPNDMSDSAGEIHTLIARTNNAEDAAYIVRAVNAHEELLAELKNVRCDECDVNYGYTGIGACTGCTDVRSVIAKAEGR